MTYHYHGIDAEESILTKSLPSLGTWALPNLFFIFSMLLIIGSLMKQCKTSMLDLLKLISK